MSVQMINPNIKTGCCPHGLPLGACPICSGMGGGIKKEVTVQKKSDELLNECVDEQIYIGNMIKNDTIKHI